MHRRPNILVIMADQHSAQVCGPYGHPIVQTPALNYLAETGVTFDNAYTNSPICVPSRMSFMTGRYINNIGVWDNGVPLREDAITWAHLLRCVGYRVALSGKMHFRGHDQWHGFEEQLAFDINARNHPSPVNWAKPLLEKPAVRTIRCGAGHIPEHDADDRATDAAEAYIRSTAKSDTPWALTVGLVAPHPPFIVPASFHKLYDLRALICLIFRKDIWRIYILNISVCVAPEVGMKARCPRK